MEQTAAEKYEVTRERKQANLKLYNPDCVARWHDGKFWCDKCCKTFLHAVKPKCQP